MLHQRKLGKIYHQKRYIMNTEIYDKTIAVHFGETSEAMRQLNRKFEKRGL